MTERTIVNQCKAHRHSTGEQCRRSAMKGATVCSTHGGRAPQVRRKAMERLADAADTVMATLIKIATDERHKAADRIVACRDLLDRAGYGPTHRFAREADVDPELVQMIHAARIRASTPIAAIEDAEVVEDDDTHAWEPVS